MARVKKGSILDGLSGAIGNQIVCRTSDSGTTLSKFPDMSKVARSEKQKERNARFAKAVAYAKEVMANPAKKQEFAQRTPKGKSVFRQALKEFLAA